MKSDGRSLQWPPWTLVVADGCLLGATAASVFYALLFRVAGSDAGWSLAHSSVGYGLAPLSAGLGGLLAWALNRRGHPWAGLLGLATTWLAWVVANTGPGGLTAILAVCGGLVAIVGIATAVTVATARLATGRTRSWLDIARMAALALLIWASYISRSLVGTRGPVAEWQWIDALLLGGLAGLGIAIAEALRVLRSRYPRAPTSTGSAAP